MTSVDLRFKRAPLTQPATLLFNEHDAAPTIKDAVVSADIALPTFGLTAAITSGAVIEAEIALPLFDIEAEVIYFTDTSRPTVAQADSRWQDALTHEAYVELPWQDGVRSPDYTDSRFQDALPLPVGKSLAWLDAIRGYRAGLVSRFQDGLPLRTSSKLTFTDALRDNRPGVISRFQDGIGLEGSWAFRFQDATRGIAGVRRMRWQDAIGFDISVGQYFCTGLDFQKGWTIRYQDAIQPDAGRHDYTIPPPELPEPCYTPSGHLRFKELLPASTHLVFVCEAHGGPVDPEPGNTVIIPVKEVYIVDNDVSLVRVDNGLVILAENVGLSLDVSSWTWSFNATVPPYYFDDLQRSSPSTPVELFASINGHDVRVIVEDIDRERTWGSSQLRLTGRGVSALLSSPFAPVMNFATGTAMNLQQLAQAVMSVNGVPLPWALDWQLADWLVPANVFSAQGTYTDVLNQIATAAGGYVQPHATDRTLRFLKKYPVLPWNWAEAEPDFELPSDAVTVEGLAWRTKPLYTRVFVHGMQGGVTVDAKRAGTAGSAQAPTITDSLITHVDAGRARAEPVLADGGDQCLVRLRTPVFEASGLILPGKLVRYVDEGVSRIGISRGLSVEGSQSESWQTIEVETHA